MPGGLQTRSRRRGAARPSACSETGLYYMRARYYDPQLGRFVSEDPIGLAGGINAYVYAGDNPVNGRDPSGECHPGKESAPLWKILPSF